MQCYDETIISYTESRDVLDLDGLARNLYPARPPFVHAVVLDGQVIGHWRRRAKPHRLGIEIQLARALKENERRALHEAAAAYGEFCGVDLELVSLP